MREVKKSHNSGGAKRENPERSNRRFLEPQCTPLGTGLQEELRCEGAERGQASQGTDSRGTFPRVKGKIGDAGHEKKGFVEAKSLTERRGLWVGGRARPNSLFPPGPSLDLK